MRRYISITMILLSVFTLFGCRAQTLNKEETAVFYYIRNEIAYDTNSGVIVPTVINTDLKLNDYESLLKKYFNGPTNYDCISPFPAGTTLVEFNIDNNKAQIVISPHMSTIQDSELTVALACLTRTVIELTGASTLQISIRNNRIYGEDHMTFSLNSFEYFDRVMPE